MVNGKGRPSSVTALYQLDRLAQVKTIVDPTKTDTIAEFYLLENLAIGLVRDDIRELSGYRGALARSWKQTDTVTWVFKLREDLRWSDGSPIGLEYIRDYYQNLSRKETRHLVGMRRLKEALLNKSTGELTFHFDGKTNDSIIHELSLADATLLHPTNLEGDWGGDFGTLLYHPLRYWQ